MRRPAMAACAQTHFICHFSRYCRSVLLQSHGEEDNGLGIVKNKQVFNDSRNTNESASCFQVSVRLPKPFVGRSSRLGGATKN